MTTDLNDEDPREEVAARRLRTATLAKKAMESILETAKLLISLDEELVHVEIITTLKGHRPEEVRH